MQQTQVATVLDRYYSPFLKRFPSVEALANADFQDVLKAWEGLGYYRRARNLHAAAGQVAAAEKFPDEVDALLELKGVGRNTAHAVAAFAFRRPVPVMEANVKRVLCRIFAIENPTDKLLWQRAEELLDRKNPFDYNQAMMDIGAVVCTKRAPKCGECPVASICKGKANPQAYPRPVKKKQTPTRHAAILAYYDNRCRYLIQRREGEFLHGLWGFVEHPVTPHHVRDDSIGSVKQIYSHFTLQAEVFRVPGKGQKGQGAYAWKSLEEIEDLPLSKADIKVVALLKESAIG